MISATNTAPTIPQKDKPPPLLLLLFAIFKTSLISIFIYQVQSTLYDKKYTIIPFKSQLIQYIINLLNTHYIV